MKDLARSQSEPGSCLRSNPSVSSLSARDPSRGQSEYFVVDFRKGWTRKPYLTFWGPDSAGYCWSLPMAGRYTAAELDASVGYHTRRRYVPSRGRYVGPWERFGVPCDVIEALASDPDREGRWQLEAPLGPIVRQSAELRKRLTALRYVPNAAQGMEARRAGTSGPACDSPSALGGAPDPLPPIPQSQTESAQ